MPFTYVALNAEEVTEAMGYTVAKDAHVVAAAKKAAVDYLVTFDEKHLLHNDELRRNVAFGILNRCGRWPFNIHNN